MPTSWGVRFAALLAIGVVGVALALALTDRGNHKKPLPRPEGQWYAALAAPYLPSSKPARGACGAAIGPRTRGVAHPTLPCGVKIYVEYKGKEALTQVIDRGPDVPGREFDITVALAKQLGLVGTREIRWRFAG
jgi:rare lipoprotein A (peptidoglycan hydrolase)